MERIKNKRNVVGDFFVDESCVCCLECVQTAPNNFQINPDRVKFWTGKVYICKQPENEEEEIKVNYALQNCLVNAIGKVKNKVNNFEKKNKDKVKK